MTIKESDVSEGVARLRELLERATPGPWQLQDGCSWRRIGTAFHDGDVLCPDTYSREDRHPDLTARDGRLYDNLRLIVEGINALPGLLDIVAATLSPPLPSPRMDLASQLEDHDAEPPTVSYQHLCTPELISQAGDLREQMFRAGDGGYVISKTRYLCTLAGSMLSALTTRLATPLPSPGVERLREALEPFARVCDAFDYWVPEAMPDFAYPRDGISTELARQDAPGAIGQLTESDFREAAAALSALPLDGGGCDAD